MMVLVTGGGGFLGRAIVERLLARGNRVRSFARGAYPALTALGVDVRQGDLTDLAAVTDAMRGCDLVFHVAARPGVWGRYQDFYRPNVLGTQNVLAASRACGVRRLVYTSSPSVVFDGRDMEGVDERVPYPDHYEAHYPKTKAIAERLVLAANGPDLATVALRPHLIWGPGDNHLVPRILERGRAGALRRFRGPAKLVDSVYVDNAADAHVLAAERLRVGSAVGGKAYFISNGEPWPLWDLVNRILQAGGQQPVRRSISPRLAYGLGWLIELAATVLRTEAEPRMTRFVARELATAHWFDLSAARRDLGYMPRVGVEEGLRRLAAWLAGGDVVR